MNKEKNKMTAYEIGESLLIDGNLDDSIDVLSKALFRNAADIEARMLLCMILVCPRKEDFSTAILLLEAGLLFDGGHAFLLLLGIAYVGEGLDGDATRILHDLRNVNLEQAERLSEEINAARMGRPGNYIKRRPIV